MIKIVLVTLMLGVTLVAVIGIAFISSQERVGEMRTDRVVIEPTAVPSPDPNLMNRGNSDEKIALVVDSPVDGSEITGTTVIVRGMTVPGAEVAVNDKDIKADNNGMFSVTLDIEEGENIISVIANNELGEMAERQIVVTVVSPVE